MSWARCAQCGASVRWSNYRGAKLCAMKSRCHGVPFIPDKELCCDGCQRRVSIRPADLPEGFAFADSCLTLHEAARSGWRLVRPVKCPDCAATHERGMRFRP